jgi:inorganic pyrophosphatase
VLSWLAFLIFCYAEPVKLYDIDPGPDSPELVRVIIEIPKNSSNKYEYDGNLGIFRLDRALYSPMHYPGDYGFIPGTLAEDGDPLDIMVLVDEPSFTGCLMEARPVGLLHMVDGKENDQKVLAVPNRNPRFESIHTIDQVFPHTRTEIEYFFSIYKELQGAKTEMRGWSGPREARRVITESREAYLDRRLRSPDAVSEDARAGTE